MKQDRPLSTAERALLADLLARDASTAAFVAQLDALRVYARCDCGCPSVEFRLPGRPRGSGSLSVPVVDAEARTPEGEAVGVLVFAADGQLTQLEVYSMSGAACSLPEPSGVDWVAPSAT